MISHDIRAALQGEAADLRAKRLYKDEHLIDTPQSAHITLVDGRELINMCANNYLGLADHPQIIAAAHQGLDRWGLGVASVRFICGTQDIHRALETQVSALLGTDDTVVFPSCFDANSGLFEVLLGPDDAVISDALNHASIIDGIRLSKAARLRFAHQDMDQLEGHLQATRTARRRLIVTDGVFSMDGHIADLPAICALADRYNALVMVDDSHAVGVLGPNGGGTPELYGLTDRVDLVTGTFGKALGGAGGGYVSGHHELITLLRQRSRPYLFSNALAPAIAAGSLQALHLNVSSNQRRATLSTNTALFRRRLGELGLNPTPGTHPIVPVIIGDAGRAARTAAALVEHGVLAVAFSHPVVPHGQARIRFQVTAAHTQADLETAATAAAQAHAAAATAQSASTATGASEHPRQGS